MEGWDNFFLAQAGASAALTGLLFVSVSINLAKILEVPTLPNRALQALILLFQILIMSSLMLIPHQSAAKLGIEVLTLALCVWILMVFYAIGNLRIAERSFRTYALISVGMSQLASLPYVVGGIFILLRGEAGIYWIAAGILLAYAKSLLEAWVLLIEINR